MSKISQIDQESIFLSEIDMSEVHCGKTRYLVVSEQLPSGETIRLLFDRKSPERLKLVRNDKKCRTSDEKDILKMLKVSQEREILLNIMNDLRNDTKVLLGGAKLPDDEVGRSFKHSSQQSKVEH